MKHGMKNEGGSMYMDCLATLALFRKDLSDPQLDKMFRLPFKDGEPELPKNYRPIAILPVLCKVYGGILLRQVKEKVERLQVLREY